jgi:dTDP-L-rhamnose 4-epimerase
MVKNILITGGSGFIGSHLALHLIERGHKVRVLDNLSEQIHGANPTQDSPLYKTIEGKVEFIRGTVTSRDDWIRSLEGQDVVVHLAAETGTGQSMTDIEHYCNVNIQATAVLLDILTNTEHTVKKVVIASSRSIYGEGKYHSKEYGAVYPGHRDNEAMKASDFAVKYRDSSELTLVPTDEESRIHPSSIYGITKQVQEQLVLCACEAAGIAGVAFRYQNVYGPGQSLTNPYTGILSIFSTLIHQGKPIDIFEDGTESRDFVYIDDVVKATTAGIENPKADHKVFNVGTGVAVSVIEAVELLMSHYEQKVPYTISGNYRLGDIRHNYADTELMERELGIKPEVDFATGLKHFTDWVKTQQ